MNTRNFALNLIAAALLAACAGTPAWDNSVFPAHPSYDATSLPGESVHVLEGSDLKESA